MERRYMGRQHIRPIAICVFRDGERILAGEDYDPVRERPFYRPLGGTIEFGERGAECIARELREELGAEVKDVRYLGAIENIFSFKGELGHEIVLVYDAEFVDRRLYEAEWIPGLEGNDPFRAVWNPVSVYRSGELTLYPDGLLELLDVVAARTEAR